MARKGLETDRRLTGNEPPLRRFARRMRPHKDRVFVLVKGELKEIDRLERDPKRREWVYVFKEKSDQ